LHGVIIHKSLLNTGMSEEMMEKLTKVSMRLQTRFILITKHPLKVEKCEDGVKITICAKGRDIPELCLTAGVVQDGLVIKLTVPPNDTGLDDIMLAFTDRLKRSFPEEDDFPRVELLVEPGKLYQFTVFTKPITGETVTTWEQMHARRLMEASMVACWSPLEAVRDILLPGLFRKMPPFPVFEETFVVKKIKLAMGESGN
jgi:hypothetical protein